MKYRPLPPIITVARPQASLHGLEKVCRLFGRMKCGDVMMVWDFANECAVPERLMRTGSKRWKASERKKWSQHSGAYEHAAREEAEADAAERNRDFAVLGCHYRTRPIGGDSRSAPAGKD